MALTLTIDRGNSRAKVVIWHGDHIEYSQVVDDVDAQYIGSLLQQYAITSAIYCSVARHSELIAQALAANSLPYIEMSPGIPAPIKIDYKTPLTLGVDRIAAAVGALSLFPGRELLVVDAGTAVTYDRLTARGHFAGGNIAPGIGMRLKALNTYTAKLPLVPSRGESQLWGTTTELAMRSGAINGVIAEISYYRSRLPQEAIVVIAGGWGHDLCHKLDFEAHYEPTLVNRGLNAILAYNNLISSILFHNENK